MNIQKRQYKIKCKHKQAAGDVDSQRIVTLHESGVQGSWSRLWTNFLGLDISCTIDIVYMLSRYIYSYLFVCKIYYWLYKLYIYKLIHRQTRVERVIKKSSIDFAIEEFE